MRKFFVVKLVDSNQYYGGNDVEGEEICLVHFFDFNFSHKFSERFEIENMITNGAFDNICGYEYIEIVEVFG